MNASCVRRAKQTAHCRLAVLQNKVGHHQNWKLFYQELLWTTKLKMFWQTAVVKRNETFVSIDFSSTSSQHTLKCFIPYIRYMQWLLMPSVKGSKKKNREMEIISISVFLQVLKWAHPQAKLSQCEVSRPFWDVSSLLTLTFHIWLSPGSGWRIHALSTATITTVISWIYSAQITETARHCLCLSCWKAMRHSGLSRWIL